MWLHARRRLGRHLRGCDGRASRLEGELRRTRGSLSDAKTQAERAMREAQIAHAWLGEAFEAIPIGLVLCDTQDRFVLWNKRYMELEE